MKIRKRLQKRNTVKHYERRWFFRKGIYILLDRCKEIFMDELKQRIQARVDELEQQARNNQE